MKKIYTNITHDELFFKNSICLNYFCQKTIHRQDYGLNYIAPYAEALIPSTSEGDYIRNYGD